MATTHTSVCESKSYFSMLSKAIHFRGRRVWRQGRTIKLIKCSKEAEQKKGNEGGRSSRALVWLQHCTHCAAAALQAAIPLWQGHSPCYRHSCDTAPGRVSLPGRSQTPSVSRHASAGHSWQPGHSGHTRRGEGSRLHEHTLPQHPTSRMIVPTQHYPNVT